MSALISPLITPRYSETRPLKNYLDGPSLRTGTLKAFSRLTILLYAWNSHIIYYILHLIYIYLRKMPSHNKSWRIHSSKPPRPFEKGVYFLGFESGGGSRIWKLRGHLFRSGHLIFQGGLDSLNGNALSLIWKVLYFKIFRLQQATFLCFFIFDE